MIRLALRYDFTSIRLSKGLSPPSCRTCSAHTKKPDPVDRAFRIKPGDFLLSHTLARAVPSGLRGLTSVFGMGTGGSLSLWSPRIWRPPPPGSERGAEYLTGCCRRKTRGKASVRCVRSKFYGQAERAISNGKLNVSPRLHIRPIKLVVFQCPSYLSVGRSHLGEGFTLICIQRLS